MSNNPSTEVAALTANRPKFEFTIPESCRVLPSDPKTVVLQLITVAEEGLANKAATAQGGQFAYEALKHSIYSADGRPITWESAGKDHFLEGCSSKSRNLLLRAFERIHVPQPQESEDFFASQKISL